MSLLKPNESVLAGLATAALVYGVYSAAVPNLTDVRTANPADPDVAGAERTAAFIAAGAVGAVSLLTKDSTVFVLGAGMVVALSWVHRHANLFDPMTGRTVSLDGHAGQVDPDVLPQH